MAQDIKYCDPALTTGLNDGSDKDNAWQSLATANTNAVANDRVRVRSNVGGTAYELTGNPGWQLNVAGTIGQPRTFIAYDWDTDTEVDQTNCHKNGGNIGVLINYNNAVTSNLGIQQTAAYNEVIGFGMTKTGAVMAFTFTHNSAGAGCLFDLCEADGFTGFGFWSNRITNIRNCLAQNGPTGFLTTYGHSNCVAINCTTEGSHEDTIPSVGFLAIGCGVGVLQGTGSLTMGPSNSAFYNCTTGIRIQSTNTFLLKNLIIENCTTGIDVQTTAKRLILQNVSHYNNTNLYGGTALATSFIEEEGVYESTVSLFKDIAGGDYSNNPLATVLKQYQNRLLENTYDNTEPGLGQVIPIQGTVHTPKLGYPGNSIVTTLLAKQSDIASIAMDDGAGNTGTATITAQDATSVTWTIPNIMSGNYQLTFTSTTGAVSYSQFLVYRVDDTVSRIMDISPANANVGASVDIYVVNPKPVGTNTIHIGAVPATISSEGWDTVTGYYKITVTNPSNNKGAFDVVLNKVGA